MTDPYQILGVPKTASDAEIKKAFRKLAKELHPDRNRDDPSAQKRFQEVSAAYDFLSDKEKRRQYDAGEIDADGHPRAPFGFGAGRAGPGGMGGGDAGGAYSYEFGGTPEDLFRDLFGGGGGGFAGGFGEAQRARGDGGRRGFQRRGQDVGYNLTVDFLDAARGAEKTLTLQGGKTLKVKIPAGLKDGQQIRLSGQGGGGILGGEAGDALITVSVREHPFFKRDGDNLRLDLPISLAEAVYGGKIKVPTLEGAVMLNIPKNSSSGQTLRLPGKGLKKGRSAAHGDLLVTLQIVLPEKPDPALETALTDWASGHPYKVRAKMGLE